MATAAMMAARISVRSVRHFSSSSTISNRAVLSNMKRWIHIPQIQIVEQGQRLTTDYRMFFLNQSGKKISPWHDIPLRSSNGLYNCVIENPKGARPKMEVATDEPYTPIKQDTINGLLRFYAANIPYNYGYLPQTWEDRTFAHPEVEGAFGDDDPVDVIEIGEKRAETGQILQVRVLGGFAMIDKGELDWKMIAISKDDPRESLLREADDVEKHFPGKVTAIREWLRNYKIPDGKPPNRFGLDETFVTEDHAQKVINECNKAWVRLVSRSAPRGKLSLC